MAKNILIKNISLDCNTAINLKRAELLKENKDLKKMKLLFLLLRNGKP